MKKSRRRVYQPEEIVDVLERFRKTGLSQPRFCKRHGVALSTLQYWLRKQREGQLPGVRTSKSPPSPNQLVPVKIVDVPLPVEDVLVEFELAHGGTLRFRGNVGPEVLARYAEALGHRC